MSGTLVTYWIGSACVWLGLSACLLLRRRLGAFTSRRPNHRHVCLWILGGALAVRLVFVFTTQPRLSDDIWRYIHDGQTMVELGHSPYRAAPSQSPLDYRGNYPNLVSIYQPTSQGLFAALAWISPEARTFRLGFVALDLLIVGLILGWLTQRGASPWWAALYAWHPLVITEVAWSGHQDGIGIALLLGSLMLADTAQRRGGGGGLALAMIGSGVCFAAAIAVKPIVVPLALVWAWSLRGHGRELGLAGTSAAFTLLALYGPFALTEPGLSGMIDTGQRFLAHWWFNPSLHAVAKSLLGGKDAADWLMGAVLVGVVLAMIGKDLARHQAAAIYLLAALLLSSTAHPWYLLWPLALVPLRFSLTLWVWSLTIGWAYFAWIGLGRTGEYSLPTWMLWVEYVPVYLALCLEVFSITPRPLIAHRLGARTVPWQSRGLTKRNQG